MKFSKKNKKTLNNKQVKPTLIFLMSLLMINFFSCTALGSRVDYVYPIEKGTKFMKVDSYNKSIWESVINEDSEPNKWFSGKSNIINAKNKQIISVWEEKSYTDWIFFIEFLIPRDELMNLEERGFGREYVDYLFEKKYNVIRGRRYIWDFANVTNVFSSELQKFCDEERRFYIFKDPMDLEILRTNYNSFAKIVNMHPSSQRSNFNIPTYNKVEFLEHLILKEYIFFGKPTEAYLNKVFSNLGNKRFSVNDNTLIIHKKGKVNYTLEISYEGDCLPSRYILKDNKGRIFYEISPISYKWIAFLIMLVMILGLLSLALGAWYRRKISKQN